MNGLNEQDWEKLEVFAPEVKWIRQTLYITGDDARQKLIFFALKDKLVEKGEWREFITFANSKYHEEEEYGNSAANGFFAWLINAPRFCGLVNELLKEKEDKDGQK